MSGNTLCRRCRRPVEEGAEACDYCGLTDPLKGAAPAEGPLARYRKLLIGGGAVALLAAGGAAMFQRGAPVAPACSDARYVAAIAELVRDNAVYELAPDVAKRFPTPVFATLARIESPGASSDGRRCKATMLLALDATATGVVERLLAMPVGVPQATRTLMAQSWHAAERRLELPVSYGITASSDAHAPWDLSIDEASVAGIRDLVGAIARAGK